MGAGKSTISKILSEKLNLNLVETDAQIEKIAKTSIFNLFCNKQEAFFRELETKLLKSLFFKKNLVVSTGGGFFVRNKNIKIAKKNGIIIFLDVPLKICKQRAKAKKRPLLTLNSKKQIEKIFIKRRQKYLKIADYITTNSSLKEEALQKIKTYLAKI